MIKYLFCLFLLCISYANAQCPSSNCIPGAAPLNNTALGLGIYRIQLATLDTTTNGSIDGYQDYSCQRRATLLQGSTYTLRVQTGATVAENVVAWLDYDNDGSFTASERVLYSLNAFTHTASFTVPTTATLNQSLRLRIAADNTYSPIPTPCSTPQYSQTEDYQVRIGTGNASPVARFVAPDSVSCTGTVVFHDDSYNTPTTWRWSFGDGSTSTQQHPTHTYAAAGTHTVKLRACNAGGCDSLTRAAYVTVRADGPRPASCQPTTVSYCCQFGITRVRLAGLDHRSLDGQAGYEDFSCAHRASLTVDRPYTLQLTTGGTSPHDVRIYLDLNDDGAFTSPGELLYYGYAVRSPAVLLTIASTATTIYNKALRLRIVADYGNSPATSPCGPVQWGQAEDYSVVLVPNTASPSAAFALSYQQRCGPVRIALTNQTTGGATSYRWDFGDGSSSAQATPPVHTYTTAGVYPVKLVAQNAFGRDSTVQRVAVATACPTYCPLSGTGGTADRPAYVTRLQLADLDNTDYRATYIGYWDFTAKTTTLQAGQTYPLRTESLPWTFAGNGPWLAIDVWIDLNQDGQFSQAEHTSSPAQYSPQTASLRIPASAKPGFTRMRVVCHAPYQRVYPTACSPTGLGGSVEDYTVLIMTPATAPTAGFLADLPTSCTGLVQFRDTSSTAPSRWQWTFGDGGTSTLQHPQHQYAAPGTYTVSLQASNAYGTQTQTRSNYVTVSSLGAGPRPAACLPVPLTGLITARSGIDTLKIGTSFFYHQSPGAAAYRDETCAIPALTLTPGTSYPMRFKSYNQTTGLAIWLDSNDNGIFEAPGELIAVQRLFNLYNTLQSPLNIPVNTLTNRPLRMRVVAWGYDYIMPALSPPGPCQRDDQTDHVRDFTVVLSGTLATTIATPAASDWQAWPNPATNQLSIKGTFTKPAFVELWDAVGRYCYRGFVAPNNTGTLALEVNTLPRGLYLLRINQSGTTTRVVLE